MREEKRSKEAGEGIERGERKRKSVIEIVKKSRMEVKGWIEGKRGVKEDIVKGRK